MAVPSRSRIDTIPMTWLSSSDRTGRWRHSNSNIVEATSWMSASRWTAAGAAVMYSAAVMPRGSTPSHHVGVGVVVQAGIVAVRVAVVVLVRPHHPADLVAVGGVVVAGDAGPEAGDLQQHLGAVGGQERQVAGDLVVLPDVVGDGEVDVALAVGAVEQPAARAWVQV